MKLSIPVAETIQKRNSVRTYAELAPVAAGDEFGNFILYATNMGLGTVWLAATFNRDSFEAGPDRNI